MNRPTVTDGLATFIGITTGVPQIALACCPSKSAKQPPIVIANFTMTCRRGPVVVLDTKASCLCQSRLRPIRRLLTVEQMVLNWLGGGRGIRLLPPPRRRTVVVRCGEGLLARDLKQLGP
jgi:hypothetical protein